MRRFYNVPIRNAVGKNQKDHTRNDPKFSDRQVWANSADPDQTAPRGAVWSESSLFAIPFAGFLTKYLQVWRLCLNFR